MKNLLIIGAGQYGMVAKEIAESMKCFEKIDFVDDVYPSAVGKICDINKLIHEYDSAVVAIGNTELRLNLIKELCEIGYEVPTLIHEKAYVSPSAKIGIGCFIEPMVVVNTAVSVETGCILSAGVVLNHNNIKMLLGNHFTSEIMKHLTFKKIPVETLGTPRNDILFLSNNEIVKDRLQLPKEKKILLFAPTFRNDGKDVEGKNLNRSGIDQIKMIDFERLFRFLHEKFGGEWVLVCRFHYHVAEMVDWEELNNKYSGRIINGNLHDDMSEYLVCADVLLTDASSCMFDFIITNKPCLLFFPDIDNYANKERGFYIPIEKLPFPLATNFDDLITAIKKINNDEYVKGIDKIRSEFGYMEDGESSQRILEWIFKDAGY